MPDAPLDVTAIVKLAARAQAMIHAEATRLHNPTAREDLQLRAAELALVAAARLAVHNRATGLVRELRRWAYVSPVYDEPISIAHALVEALSESVRAGVEPELLEPLLAEPADWIVAKLAAALDPAKPGELELLQGLTNDPRTAVAKAACRRLGPLHAWAWHAGIFADDPIAAHADQPDIVDALTRARAALGREYAEATPGEVATLCAAVDELPPALALPLLDAGVRVFASLGSSRACAAEPDGGPVVRLHALGGLDAVLATLERLAAAHGDPEFALVRVSDWCCALPDPVRVDLARRLLPWIEARAQERTSEPAAAAHARGMATGSARLLASLWPHTCSPLPLVEWLAARKHAYGLEFHLVEAALQNNAGELEPDAERLLELVLAQPGLVDRLSKLFARLGASVSLPLLAALAGTAAAADHSTLRRWALEQRTGRLAPTDPDERDALARAWLDEPDTREAILDSPICLARVLPWLRRRLEAGELTLFEASATITAIGRLYGGVVNQASLGRARKVGELEAAERRAAARAELGVWLDPSGSPPTAREWGALRALAHAHLADPAQPPWGILATRPVGPWTPEDLALLDALEARSLPSDPVGSIIRSQYQQLLTNADVPDAPTRARRLLDAWQGHAQARDELDMVELRKLAADATDPSPQPIKTSALDWMDEDEHEELDS